MKPLLLSLLVLAAATPAPAQSPQNTARPEKAAAAPAPATLTVWNHPIVVFRAPVRNVNPAERAARAAQRIEAIPADIRPDEIKAEAIVLGEVRGVLVLAGDRTLFGIVPEDLDPSTGETPESAAALAIEQIRAVLQARADQRRWPLLIRGLGLSIVATAGLPCSG